VIKFIGMLPTSCRGWSRGEMNFPVTSGSSSFAAMAESFAVAADSIGRAHPWHIADKQSKTPRVPILEHALQHVIKSLQSKHSVGGDKPSIIHRIGDGVERQLDALSIKISSY
jgi:hypothetical protein